MSNMTDNEVFEPIDDLFAEMCRDVKRMDGDAELAFTVMKIALMRAYQRGQNDTLDEVRSWL